MHWSILFQHDIGLKFVRNKAFATLVINDIGVQSTSLRRLLDLKKDLVDVIVLFLKSLSYSHLAQVPNYLDP